MMKNVLPEIFDESAEESTSASATRAQKRHVSHMFASERPEKCVSRNSTVRPRWRPVFPYPVKISIPPGGGHQKYSRVRRGDFLKSLSKSKGSATDRPKRGKEQFAPGLHVSSCHGFHIFISRFFPTESICTSQYYQRNCISHSLQVTDINKHARRILTSLPKKQINFYKQTLRITISQKRALQCATCNLSIY